MTYRPQVRWPLCESEHPRKSGTRFAHRVEVKVFHFRIADNTSGDTVFLRLHYPGHSHFSNRIIPRQSGSSAAKRLPSKTVAFRRPTNAATQFPVDIQHQEVEMWRQ